MSPLVEIQSFVGEYYISLSFSRNNCMNLFLASLSIITDFRFKFETRLLATSKFIKRAILSLRATNNHF